MKQNIFSLTCILLCLLTFFSCTSTSKTAEVDPDFLGDYDPIQLEDGMARTVSFGNEKPKELEIYFVPRTNRVEIYFRDGMNKICIILTPEHRKLLMEAASNFFAGTENGTLEDRKPAKKNAYSETKCSVGWGLTGVSHTTKDARLQFNYEYLSDKRPYFMMKVLPGIDSSDSSMYSPSSALYFSPTQLENFCTIILQENLQALVDELNQRAYEY